MLTTIEWAGCIFGSIGALMLASNSWLSYIGWRFFLASSLLFVLYALLTGAYGLTTQNLVFTSTNLLGIYRTRHTRPARLFTRFRVAKRHVRTKVSLYMNSKQMELNTAADIARSKELEKSLNCSSVWGDQAVTVICCIFKCGFAVFTLRLLINQWLEAPQLATLIALLITLPLCVYNPFSIFWVNQFTMRANKAYEIALEQNADRHQQKPQCGTK